MFENMPENMPSCRAEITRRMALSSAIAFAMAMTANTQNAAAESAPQMSVSLPPGQSHIIELIENPSTGYLWRVTESVGVDTGIVSFTDLGFVKQGDRKMIGAPGKHRWEVRTLRSGTARFEFKYLRPWEPNAPIKTIRVMVNVQ